MPVELVSPRPSRVAAPWLPVVVVVPTVPPPSSRRGAAANALEAHLEREVSRIMKKGIALACFFSQKVRYRAPHAAPGAEAVAAAGRASGRSSLALEKN